MLLGDITKRRIRNKKSTVRCVEEVGRANRSDDQGYTEGLGRF